MNIFVLAPDSFKESMTAEQACQAMQKGILKVLPDAVCIHVPMADGGEGTVDALVNACGGQKVFLEVSGSLVDQRVQSDYGLIDNGQTAVIEMAKANGLDLLQPSLRNPLITSSYGTGEMMMHALNQGVKKIIIGLGGSVTNDAGAGMAQALGIKFLNASGDAVELGGGHLDHIQSIDCSERDTRLADVAIIIASDVNNPLCGEQGASYVFAPQKGATAEMVRRLDQNLKHFSNVVKATIGQDFSEVAGAGAAGGLGFGLMAFADAEIQSGAALMIAQTHLAEKVAQADYVFTGEGSIDFQTKFGKTPWAVAQVAKTFEKPVIAFAGRVGHDIESLYAEGFDQIVSINPPDCDLATALKNAEINLTNTTARMVVSLKEASSIEKE